MHPAEDPARLPLIDVAPLVEGGDVRQQVAEQLGAACRDWGFFYIVGHGVDEALIRRLEEQSRAFFAQDLDTKLEIRMELGGRAWRGFFPVGDELTSGKPDRKEGIYFGTELDAGHPLVAAGVPLHGRNLFPAHMPAFRRAVLDYMAAMTRLGHALMAGIAVSLGREASFFADRYTSDPLTLFRIFNYPPQPDGGADVDEWGVGEHTDYGLLTMLRQDDAGGLQVKSPGGWIAAPPVDGSFVCNIGDMLGRLSDGRYRSTPHRVRNLAARDRLSFPFFFDPSWDARIPGLDGTYGDYVLAKVGNVFPDLGQAVL
jgi:isopenicillin N synthase-like dioxygenase